MTLALFDLDNTLLGGDSDHAWGQFMATRGLVDEASYAADNDRFYQNYLRGELDAIAYQQFCMKPLAGKSVDAMAELHREFMARHIAPIWLPDAEALVEKHRSQGHRLIVITATNRFVVSPIVEKFGIVDLICSETEIVDGKYTGNLVDEPCVGQGKVTKLERWMAAAGETLEGAFFYSDSHNDLPLLNLVENSVAVDPDERLKAIAQEKGWPVISLRQGVEAPAISLLT